jgi:hypothetical protein
VNVAARVARPGRDARPVEIVEHIFGSVLLPSRQHSSIQPGRYQNARSDALP